MVLHRFRLAATIALVAGGVIGESAFARFADVLGYFEPGNNVGTVEIGFGGFQHDNAEAALGGPELLVETSSGDETNVVSLGGWTDDPNTGQGHTPALVVGFSTPVPNIAGSDFRVVGNAFPTFHEPATVEVARESSGGGATETGWNDEQFFLLRPANFDQLDVDPRTGPHDIAYSTQTPGEFDFVYGPGPFQDPAQLQGYVDVTPGGDDLDISWAIDASNQFVSLDDIAYVRIRTVTDSSIDFTSIEFDGTTLGIDFFSAEVDYIEVIPEPSSLIGVAVGAIGLVRRPRGGARRGQTRWQQRSASATPPGRCAAQPKRAVVTEASLIENR